MSEHSYIAIAGNASLWFRYFPATQLDADWQFKRLSVEEKIGMLMQHFGPDPYFDTLVRRAYDEGLVAIGQGLWLSSADMVEMMLERFACTAGVSPETAPYWLLKEGGQAPTGIHTGFDLAASMAYHALLRRRPDPVEQAGQHWQPDQVAA